MDSLKEACAGLGYRQGHKSHVEYGYQRVALYEVEDKCQHAAVQMPNGLWHSKMGHGPVIEHRSPESLSGGMYGDATVYMRMTCMRQANREIEDACRLPSIA